MNNGLTMTECKWNEIFNKFNRISTIEFYAFKAAKELTSTDEIELMYKCALNRIQQIQLVFDMNDET